jgi:hypothetical protein
MRGSSPRTTIFERLKNKTLIPAGLTRGSIVTSHVDIPKNMKAENLTSKSILAGSPQKNIDDLKAVEAAGISEVILYFNEGLTPNAMAIEHMNRFMNEIAPRFANSTETLRAAD